MIVLSLCSQGQWKQQHTWQPVDAYGAVCQQPGGSGRGAHSWLPGGEAQVRGAPVSTAAQVGA